MRISILAGALALALSSTAAFAADFTGPRAEVRVGYDSLNVFDDNLAYGVGVGYDIAVTPKVTVGVLAGVDFSDINATFVTGRNQTTRFDAGRDVELGARLGYKLTDNVLVFGKAAYANSRVKGAINGSTVISRGDEEGYRLGAGAELALGRSLYATVGYDHTDYGRGVNRDTVKVGAGFRF